MTAAPGLGTWLRRQREDRSWTRTEMARRLIRAAHAAGDAAMPAAENVAASIYRWERGTITPSDRYRLSPCPSQQDQACRPEQAPVLRKSARRRQDPLTRAFEKVSVRS
jgi:hypothetical protein